MKEKYSYMKEHFIRATEKFNTFDEWVAAPYVRKSFTAEKSSVGKITVAVAGFYRLFFNGVEITRGFLSPYIANPNHYVYCDEYDVNINEGENVIALMLGNGYQNNPGGYVWRFDLADFRSSPLFSLSLEYSDGGKKKVIYSDESFKTHPSPILSDDYRFYEVYDARQEIDGWCKAGFDDSEWDNMLSAEAPKGKIKLCEAPPIVIEKELSPISITKDGDGYIYDFGECNAGLCRLTICGNESREITLTHGELLKDGTLYLDNLWNLSAKDKWGLWDRDMAIIHRDVYISKGAGKETYMPSFEYHGFRYVRVTGIKKEEATKELLTFVVFHTKVESMGGFECSDEVANKLQQMTRRSDVSNLHHFPTDCPQREKNGWTADAALSAEQLLLNFNPEETYREWHNSICAAQNELGALPGIVPTAGWGFEWGNGPAWDQVLVVLPYYVYLYRGKTDMIESSKEYIYKYLRYLNSRKDERGLLEIGLGDWCPVGQQEPITPLVLTDSIVSMDIANKSAVLFDAVGYTEAKEYAENFAREMRESIRKNLIDYKTYTAHGNCQSSQAMALYYGIFDKNEEEAALKKLLSLIDEADGHITVGVLGGRVIFYVLSKFGYADLAYNMITRPDYPSYGNWIERGATTLWENFHPTSVNSTNHHFWGFISGWFITDVAGIKLNPNGNNLSELEISPSFIEKLELAKAHHIAPDGKIEAKWEREGEKIILSVTVPEKMTAKAKLPKGYVFEDGECEKAVTSGKYTVVRK